MATQGELVELAGQLRTVIEAVEAGDLPAEVDQVGWLRGAVAVLDVLAGEAEPAASR